MKKRYAPPKQSGRGQLFDCIFLLALVYCSLMIPLLVDFGGGAEATDTATAGGAVTWESLGQNETMAGQWEKLGFEPSSAAEMINSRFDYTVEPISLIVTALIILGYFIFILRVSDKEYREVIAERFDR